MRPFALILTLIAAAAFAQLPEKKAQEGWIMLFDGQTTFGWQNEGGGKWHAEGGVLVGEPEGPDGWLRTTTPFADFVLTLEFRKGEAGNSGVFIRSAKDGAPHETGYEFQIWDEHPEFPTGSMVNHAPAKRVKLAPGKWHTYEIRALADSFQVSINGRRVLDAKDPKAKFGFIGLQHKEGQRIEFRNIVLRPLGLSSIFDGRDLRGWSKVDTPRAKEPPVWSVKGGLLHVEKGPGQLETEATYDDFILQLDVRANSSGPGHHPNSGVFLRGDPKVFWSGYESQIRNEYKDDDPTQPVDFGTGGIYHHQPARKIVAKDNTFFTKTIAASGRHLAVWVNGHQVSDWEDPNPEGNNVRQKQAKLTPGTISLQAHDPTTNLDFRNLRIVRLPKR
ncbi:MAG: DUF1080 domain-containing protein [Bryobacterales bacterium]|nr:DUF1080 domain-containing protein [Bryobacterales bacterium]